MQRLRTCSYARPTCPFWVLAAPATYLRQSCASEGKSRSLFAQSKAFRVLDPFPKATKHLATNSGHEELMTDTLCDSLWIRASVSQPPHHRVGEFRCLSAIHLYFQMLPAAQGTFSDFLSSCFQKTMLKWVMRLATPKVPLVKSNEKHVPIDLANAGKPAQNFTDFRGRQCTVIKESTNF